MEKFFARMALALRRMTTPPRPIAPHRSDRAALTADWRAVGEDWRAAMTGRSSAPRDFE